MATQRIAFTEWLPDQPTTANALLEANNVYPLTIGYGPFPLSADYSSAASEDLNNVTAAKFNLETQLFAGGTTKLFKFNPATTGLANVSKTGNYSSSERWSFTQFGSAILASNNSAKIQAWYVGTSSLFADVSATAPIAKFITVVRDFVVAANISGTPNKLQWSDINDETDWTSGGASQADYQLIAEGGNITGITGGEFGIVLLERAIYRMSYIGSPLFFQFDAISRNLGCNTPGSVTQYGPNTYFLADDGFYGCDGTTVYNIGNDKVDEYFYDNMALAQQETISAAVDPIRNIVVWNYPNTSGGRSLLIYNWLVKKWSSASTTSEYIVSLASSTIALEGLDAYGTIDTLPASLDSRIWSGGKFLFGGADGAKIVTFTGVNSTASIVVGEMEFGYNSIVTNARSQIDNGAVTIAVASRKELDDAVTYSSTVTQNSDGKCPLRSYGRYHRLKVTPTGTWTHAISVDVDYTPSGGR
jgi:hypothetical protein